jgi:multimeric flavodoxin WrbA
MHLLVLNGSPRGPKGNTQILFDELTAGFTSVEGHPHEVVSLNNTEEHEELAARFWQCKVVMIGFPLYVDAMPAKVKLFIEHIGVAAPAAEAHRPLLGFLVQSGFSEASHSRRVERYLTKLANRLKCQHAGIIIKGGCEGLRLMPKWMTGKIRKRTFRFGEQLARDGYFDRKLLARFAKPERLGIIRRASRRILTLVFNENWYWDSNLRKHNSFDRRFAKPFEDQWPDKTQK